MIYDNLIIKEEHRKEAINLLKRPYNFFKHADKYPSGTIEFNPIGTEFFIRMTSVGLKYLGREPDAEQKAFNMYWDLRNSDYAY